LKRIALATALVGLAVGGCGKARDGAARTPAEELDAALRPATLASTIKKLPGAHWRGSALFRISPTGQEAAGVTTTTDLWLDRKGGYRLVENNDQDGGREVFLVGKELAVAIKPGKMIRRSAQEPEPTRLFEEAVGAPWAAWETVRRFAAVERSAPGTFTFTRSAHPLTVAASLAETTPLRRWRDNVSVEALEGEARFDPQTGAPLAFTMKARFSAKRDDHVPLTGELAVTTKLDGIGSTANISAPVAEPLHQRQRTILEERALLGELGRPATKEDAR
jgi:hypothetical protein